MILDSFECIGKFGFEFLLYGLECSDLAYVDLLLRQVWENLISNALKYSSRCAQPAIEVSGHRDHAETVYCVRDNGVGFSMEHANKLFGVFQRLHHEDQFSGTGVGLAIVQRLVSRHGGRVWAEGKVDEGAVFSFALPHGDGT